MFKEFFTNQKRFKTHKILFNQRLNCKKSLFIVRGKDNISMNRKLLEFLNSIACLSKHVNEVHYQS